MGSGQCVPKDSPLTCVLEIFKSLLLTELKGNRLKQLCIQIWPQYQLDNQDRWPEFSAFDFNVLQNLTDFLKRNGKWCRRSPMPKRFGPFGAGPHYAKPAPSTRSFYAPCLPSKRALLQLTAHLDLPHPGTLGGLPCGSSPAATRPLCRLSRARPLDRHRSQCWPRAQGLCWASPRFS